MLKLGGIMKTILALALLCFAVSARATCTGYPLSSVCIPAESIIAGTLDPSVQGSGCGAANLPGGVTITYGLRAGSMTTTGLLSATGAVGASVTYGLAAGSVTVNGVGIINALGQIPALSSAYFASLSGANLTAIPAASIVAGSLGTGDFAITGKLSLASAFTPQVATKATINAITGAVGRVYSCSDCTNTYTLCVATGTAANQYREIGTATACQ